ncbi:MAG: energy-coupling factor ABC transporter ATP-binding protein [Spirochaetia bacterium]|nr:energy-coupling factor ABC transporter ATP-binding protein [Spirochaetia bacterium]
MKAIEVENVSKIFPDKTKALEDVSFAIEEGEFVVIAGSNGSGKSVLMSLIAKLDSPSSGTIKTSTQTGLVFQDADAQILGETSSEDVAFGIRNCGYKKEIMNQKTNAALEATGLLYKKDSAARTMSGGEKRRLAVSGILAMDRNIFIFDEPFANLDWPGIKKTCAILKQLKEQKKTVVVLTHELEKILALADRFIVLDKGKVRYNGTAQEGLKLDLEQWSIKNPLVCGMKLENLLWL